MKYLSFLMLGLGRTLVLAAALLVGAANFGAGDAAAQAKGTFKDTRDGKTYKTVTLKDGKTYMTQPLNYKTGTSWCYGGKDANCAKYGRLYDAKTAEKACPTGWKPNGVNDLLRDALDEGQNNKDIVTSDLRGGCRMPNGKFQYGGNQGFFLSFFGEGGGVYLALVDRWEDDGDWGWSVGEFGEGFDDVPNGFYLICVQEPSGK